MSSIALTAYLLFSPCQVMSRSWNPRSCPSCRSSKAARTPCKTEPVAGTVRKWDALSRNHPKPKDEKSVCLCVLFLKQKSEGFFPLLEGFGSKLALKQEPQIGGYGCKVAPTIHPAGRDRCAFKVGIAICWGSRLIQSCPRTPVSPAFQP